MNAAAQKLVQRCLGGPDAIGGQGAVATHDGPSAGQPFDLTQMLAAFTLEVVGSTAFG